MTITGFLPRERVYLQEMECSGVVTSVKLTTYGTEYLVRYFLDNVPYEVWFYDFEVSSVKKEVV